MSTIKWVLSAVCAAGGAAALTWAVLQAPPARAAAERAPLRALELRAFPGPRAAPPPPPPSALTADDEPEPLHPIPPPDGGRPVPIDARPPPGSVPAVPAPRPAPPPSADGSLTLSASDTADIYLDGKKVGSSPMRGVKVRAGTHKVRFDCYDAAGNAVTGQVKVVTVTADQELAVTYPCPESQ